MIFLYNCNYNNCYCNCECLVYIYSLVAFNVYTLKNDKKNLQIKKYIYICWTNSSKSKNRETHKPIYLIWSYSTTGCNKLRMQRTNVCQQIYCVCQVYFLWFTFTLLNSLVENLFLFVCLFVCLFVYLNRLVWMSRQCLIIPLEQLHLWSPLYLIAHDECFTYMHLIVKWGRKKFLKQFIYK